MNDFTKKDLHHLIGLMNYFSASNGSEWNLPLRGKIQSMIDSHDESMDEQCAHRWVLTQEEPMAHMFCSDFRYVCVKCHREGHND